MLELAPAISGETGERGPAGPAGHTGYQGPAGPEGPIGPQGNIISKTKLTTFTKYNIRGKRIPGTSWT